MHVIGEYPDNRVLLCGDLGLQHPDTGVILRRHFQLTPRELQYYSVEGGDADRQSNVSAQYLLRGRIFIEKATFPSADDRGSNLSFVVKSASNIVLNCIADTIDAKQMWMQGIRRQVRFNDTC